MDAKHFDDLLRVLTAASGRRGVFSGLAGLLLAGPLAALGGLGEAAAKKKRKKKKKCKGCAICQQCKKGKCKPKPDGTDCGDSRSCQSGACVCPTACCSNADCGFQGACEAGICDCKSGARFCKGTCIPEGDCCTDDECPDGSGQTCQGGHCACPSGHKDCGGDCIPLNACCDDDDCDGCEVCENQTCVVSACCPKCPSGQECLSNGSCATVCVEQADCTGCSGGCSFASVEGPQHCIESVFACENIPQVCTSTSECPIGQHCQPTTCFDEKRCFPLCNP